MPEPIRPSGLAGDSAVSQCLRGSRPGLVGPSLSDMLSTDVGQSAQLRTVNPNSLHQVFADLRISSTTVLETRR